MGDDTAFRVGSVFRGGCQFLISFEEGLAHSQYHLRKQVGSSDTIRLRGWY